MDPSWKLVCSRNAGGPVLLVTSTAYHYGSWTMPTPTSGENHEITSEYEFLGSRVH